jgi:hypothetical protein
MDRVPQKLLTCLLLLFVAASAVASGFPPIAFDDSITVERGGTANRLDSGNASVLDNDFDLERDDLTAVLDQEPKHGSLELLADGTFIYIHDGSKADDDKFRYSAFDGTRRSRSATVEIEIEDVPNDPPRVVGEVGDQEAAEGAEFQLELAGYFTDPDDGDILTYGAKGLPDSGSLAIDPTSGLLSGIPEQGDARSKPYDVEIRATDRFGESASLKFDLYIREERRADVTLDVRVVANPVGVGETSRWDIVVGNNGPGVFETGELSAEWATAGPALSLVAPAGCSLSANNTSTPALLCGISNLAVGASITFSVEGLQGAAGDNSLIGVVPAEDRDPSNNADLASAQIVAEFSEGPTQVLAFAGADVAAGDLNGDGAVDIAAAGAESIVYFNNGARALSTQGSSLGGASGGSAIALLDWNGDSILDIAIGGLANRTAEVFTNDGSGTFSSASPLQASVGQVLEVAGADLDADGRSELVIAGTLGIVVARNGADLVLLSTTGALGVTTYDIDQDGDKDILAIRASDRAVELYYNSGSDLSFSRTDLQFGSVGALGIADVDGDGAADLLLGLDGDDLQTPRHQVAYQQGGGQFIVGQSFGASPVSGLLSGDINGDGWSDVAAVNESGVHQVYLGSALGDLTLAPEQLVSNGMQQGVLIDFNSDESLDLVLVGPDSVLEIHANNGIGSLGLGDRVAPNLQLLGETTVSLPAGANWVDPGATAVDDIDGDISDQISTSGTVNTAVVGTQSLTYQVTDRAGNTSSATRTIQIGVNEGTGGGGGGSTSPMLLLLGLLLAALRRRHIL